MKLKTILSRLIGGFMLHKKWFIPSLKWIMDYWSFHSLWMRIRIHLCKAMIFGSCIQQTYICLQSYIKTLSSAAGLEIWYKILFLSFLLASVIFITLFFIAERKLPEHIGKKKKKASEQRWYVLHLNSSIGFSYNRCMLGEGIAGHMTLDELLVLEKNLEMWMYHIRATKVRRIFLFSRWTDSMTNLHQSGCDLNWKLPNSDADHVPRDPIPEEQGIYFCKSFKF